MIKNNGHKIASKNKNKSMIIRVMTTNCKKKNHWEEERRMGTWTLGSQLRNGEKRPPQIKKEQEHANYNHDYIRVGTQS